MLSYNLFIILLMLRLSLSCKRATIHNKELTFIVSLLTLCSLHSY